MNQLKQNWVFCVIWLILLAGLTYCGLQTATPLIAVPPLVLMLLMVLTGRAPIRYIFYVWMALLLFMSVWKLIHPFYTAAHLFDITVVIISILLVFSTIIWNHHQRHL